MRIRTDLTKESQRGFAINTARSIIRNRGEEPETKTAIDALLALDDFARRVPHRIAAEWYLKASKHQLNLFRREWNAWLKLQEDRKAGI